ncbi:hypothetical protein ACF0H5_002078 [Mactra antiquata]
MSSFKDSVEIKTFEHTSDNFTWNLTTSMTDELLQIINDEAAYNLIPVFVTCGIIMLFGIIGNGLVVKVYWSRMNHSAKRTFILALALLDLMVCAVVIPFELYDLRNQYTFQYESVCKSMRFLEYTTVLTAGFVLVSISFERYYFICKAFQDFNSKKAKLICLTCALVAMVIATPSTIFAGSKTRRFQNGAVNITGCECSMNSEDHNNDSFKRLYYYCLAAIFFGCFLIFIVIYAIIGHLLWKYHKGKLIPDIGKLSEKAMPSNHEVSKQMSLENSSGQSHGSCFFGKDRTMKVHGKRCIKSVGSIVIFFSVTVAFVLSFLPHIIVRLLMFFNINLGSELLYNFMVRSYLISNVCNPFIYSILNKSFRKELKRTFKCFLVCWPSRDVSLVAEARRHYV